MKAPALTGVFETLAQQHRQAMDLLELAASLESPAQREQKWAEARRLLLSHERAESQVVYALLEDEASARAVVELHRRQAEELETAIAELDAAPVVAEDWIGRLRDLIAILDDHIRDEEQEFFPLAQQVLGEGRVAELQSAFGVAQRDISHELS